MGRDSGRKAERPKGAKRGLVVCWGFTTEAGGLNIEHRTLNIEVGSFRTNA